MESHSLPTPAARSSVQRFYRFHAYIYDWTRWTILHGRRKAVARLGVVPDGEVLEIGCGTGLNFAYVLEALQGRGRLMGLDFSADMLRRAERRVASRGWSNIELVQGDATQLALGRQFDAILFAYSLTMIPDWRAALRRAYDHLKPGGRLGVLDFGRFRGWGPFGALMRGWLRWNHVETLQPYADVLRDVCGNAEVYSWCGGYNFTAIGRRTTSSERLAPSEVLGATRETRRNREASR